MNLIDEHVKPVTERFTSLRWFGVSIVVGFFLGFLDTLILAAIMGSLGIKVPAYVGVPTTLTGYFFSGMVLGSLSPSKVFWEIPAGILVCAFLLVMGLFGIRDHGILSLFLNYLVVPAIAVGVTYLGVTVARKRDCKASGASPADGANT